MIRIACLAALWMSAAPARAQEPSPAERDPPAEAAEVEQAPGEEDEPEDRARTLFEEAVSAFDAGRYEEALERFRRSYVIRPTPLVLYNIAVTERRLGHDVQAIRHLREYLAEADEDDPRRGVILGELEELHGRVAQVTVEVTPPGAEVRVDGRSAGHAPLAEPLVLPPGSHRIEVEAEGHGPVSQVLELRPGERRTVQLELRDRTPRAPPVLAPEQREVDLAPAETPERDGGATFWESPWPWIVGGVLLVGAGVGLWLWLGDEPETLEGDFGPPVVRALR